MDFLTKFWIFRIIWKDGYLNYKETNVVPNLLFN